jgi:DNA-binding LacI/PurR family transcriptional regulator
MDGTGRMLERANGRRPTMADVAAHAGVSHQTVSRVLNHYEGIRPATRDRVLDAIRVLGYRRNDAARRLASIRSGLLGVVTAALPQYGPASILVGLENAARNAGYRVTATNVMEVTETNFLMGVEHLLEQAVEALVLVVPHRGIVEVAQALEVDVPVVVVQGNLSSAPLTAGVDNVAGARAATRHLLGLGHSTVVHVAGPQDWTEAGARVEGWRAELESQGRQMPAERWVGDWSARSGHAIGESLARDPEITAVFSANDQMALGVVRALVSHGRRVPEDVSVVGFDDLPEAAYFSPPLTTMRQPFGVLATDVIDLVSRALAGEEAPQMPLIPAELVVRNSTAPPPSRG